MRAFLLWNNFSIFVTITCLWKALRADLFTLSCFKNLFTEFKGWKTPDTSVKRKVSSTVSVSRLQFLLLLPSTVMHVYISIVNPWNVSMSFILTRLLHWSFVKWMCILFTRLAMSVIHPPFFGNKHSLSLSLSLYCVAGSY